MSGLYKKRPVVVAAVQYHGAGPMGNLHELLNFTGQQPSNEASFDALRQVVLNNDGVVVIRCDYGTRNVHPTNWVVRKEDGDLGVFTDDQFRVRYEVA